MKSFTSTAMPSERLLTSVFVPATERRIKSLRVVLGTQNIHAPLLVKYQFII